MRNGVSRSGQIGRRCFRFEGLEPRQVFATLGGAITTSASTECGWLHNAVQPADVTNDGWVSPLDALEVINLLISDVDCVPIRGYPDVSNDAMVSPLDAMFILNALNQVASQSVSAVNGENELADTLDEPTEAPPVSLLPIEDVVVTVRSPLHVPLIGIDSERKPLSYTVSTDRADLKAELIAGTNLVVEVDGFGRMVFRLFDSEVPRAVERIVTLTEGGFYNGLLFHRVVDGLGIQAGDPSGNGAGGSSLSNFDDQFDLDLQHNRTGVLSMAKNVDDANNSQFIITSVPLRNLDFQHTVFGQLIEGDSVRQAISLVPTTSDHKPLAPVVIREMHLEESNTDGLLRLSAMPGAEGPATVRVQVVDSRGNSVEQTFSAMIVADTANGAPFLNDIPPQVTVFGTPAVIFATAQDKEGDPIVFTGSVVSGSATIDVDAVSGRVTVFPASGFVGNIVAEVRVYQASIPTTSDPFDSQRVTISVLPPPPAFVGLAPGDDTGFSVDDEITNRSQVRLVLQGVRSDAIVHVLQNGQLIASETSVVDGATRVAIDFPADGIYTLSVRQTVGGVTSNESSPFTIQVDRLAPPPPFVLLPESVLQGETLLGEVDHVDENGPNPIRYRMIEGPSGMTVDSRFGQIVWSTGGVPTGVVSVVIGVEDRAGNITSTQRSVTVLPREVDLLGRDLVAFAGQLAMAGVKLYGASWDVNTTTQRAMFDDGRSLLKFEDVTGADRSRLPVADSLQIRVFPTWVFPDGSRLEGVQTLSTLSLHSGIALEQSGAPSLLGLADVTLFAGSPLHIPLDGYSPLSEGLVYEVRTDNPGLLTAEIETNRRSLRLDVEAYGEMLFLLFDQQVPQLTQSFEDVVGQGIYSNLNWHQVNESRIQTGDSASLGFGVGDSGTRMDQFHGDLQHNQPGVLSLTKAVDDGNGMDFFIARDSQRVLDFHNSILGQQVEGADVRESIGRGATTVGGRPMFATTLRSAKIFNDNENGLLLLKAAEGQTGSATVFVTVVDGRGARREYSFHVDVQADVSNSGPFIRSVTVVDGVTVADGSQVHLRIDAVDVEGDAVRYFARATGPQPFEVQVDEATGNVIVHRPADYSGPLELQVGVGPKDSANQLDRFDRQWIVIPGLAVDQVFADAVHDSETFDLAGNAAQHLG